MSVVAVPSGVATERSRSAVLLRRADLLVAAALFAVVFATYWPVRHFDYVRYDDDKFIFGNEQAAHGLTVASATWAVTHLVLANYMPLPVLSLLADVSLWGMNPGPMHVENVIIQGLAAIGWYLVWVKLTGWRGRSFMVAALFGVHPMHVEPVAWITERVDLLCMLLLVGSLLTYVQFVRTNWRFFYALSIALLSLAVLAKPLAMVFPGILLLLNVWPLRRLRWGSRSLTGAAIDGDAPRAASLTLRAFLPELCPYLIIAAGAAILGFFARASVRGTLSLDRWPLRFRLVNVAFGYSTYLFKFFWPEPMIVGYPLRTTYSLGAVVAAAGLLALMSFIVWKNVRGRPYLLFGWLWFLGTLLPTIGFVQAGAYSMADRYTYLPYVGLSVAVVWWAADLWTAAVASRALRQSVAAAVCFGTLLGCALESRHQLRYWTNSYALWTHAYTVAPDNVEVLKAVGTEFRLNGQLDLATECYARSVAINPNDYDAQTKFAGILIDIDPHQALLHYERAVSLAPQFPFCWWDLGLCQERLNEPAEAAANYRKALQVDPYFQPAIDSLKRLSLTSDAHRSA